MQQHDETYDPLTRALALWGPAQQPPDLETAKDPNKPNGIAVVDSWGKLPREWIWFGAPANIMDHLQLRGQWNWTVVGENGQELLTALTGPRKLRLRELLEREHFDVMLLSLGGNGILGVYDMPDLILSRGSSVTPWNALTDAFYRRLETKRLVLLDLIDWVRRSAANPNLSIVHHTYDLMVPMPKGAAFFGDRIKYQGGRSWMFPYLVQKGWTDPAEQRQIVRRMLEKFKGMLLQVAKANPQYHVIDTQGTCQLPEEQADEIHLNSEGFGKITDKIEVALAEVSLRKPAERSVEAQAAHESSSTTLYNKLDEEIRSDADFIFVSEEVAENRGPCPSFGEAALTWWKEEAALWERRAKELAERLSEPHPRTQSLAAEREALVATLEADAERRAAERCAAKVEPWLRKQLRAAHLLPQFGAAVEWPQRLAKVLENQLAELPAVLGAAAPDRQQIILECREKVEAWLSAKWQAGGNQGYMDSLIAELPEVLKP